jgi:hypothetical protein
MNNTLQVFIEGLLAKEDPIGIVVAANYDEYRSEAKLISTIVKPINTVEQVLDIVYKVFVESFDEQIAGEKKKYRNIAEQIFAKIQTMKQL